MISRDRRGAVPLDEDRALVRAVDDRAATGRTPIGHEEAHRTLHAEKARRWKRDRPRKHALDDGFSQS